MTETTESASSKSQDSASALLNTPQDPITWIKTLELSYEIGTAGPIGQSGGGGGEVQQQAAAAGCFSCGKVGDKLLRCSRCGAARYCDRECQVHDWKAGRHKLACASYKRVGSDMSLKSDEDRKEVRKEIFQRIRFYVCPYAVHKTSILGKGFLFVQSDSTLATLSLTIPKDASTGQPTPLRALLVHFLTLGEYDSEICRDDFELAAVRGELQRAVAGYDEQEQVVLLFRFRCGHVAVGTAKLVPDYRICKKLGHDYYAESNSSAPLQLNIDDV